MEQLPTGTILVHELVTTNNAVLYARVSGDQAADLDRQMQRLRDYAAAQGLRVVQEGSPRDWLWPERSSQETDEGSGESICFEHRGRAPGQARQVRV